MKYHRLKEVIELLQPLWQEYPELNLAQLLQKLADEAGFKGNLCDLTDDTLIYHLKMCNSPTEAAIPGLQKDHEDD
uniref:Protein YihD n=1 Tax=Arsenophonus endosymbiont of Trialeurodes vaporariorum TaxID=235567 RepID=A0A3B0MMV5_9GAMM